MKNQFTYKETMDTTAEALDLLDIKSFLQKDLELYSIMMDIQDYIDYSYKEDAIAVQNFMKQKYPMFGEYLETEIFNWMTGDEFIDYCKKRYPEVKWGYQNIEKYWVAQIGDK